MAGPEGTLRLLTAEDVTGALQLSAEAGWNQTAEDWCMLLQLAPEGCLGIEVEGELATTTTLVRYGRRLAWIGMVLTRIKFRGRGFAKRLLVESLALADRMKIETVKLDATDLGQPLYEKLGFRPEQPVERWGGPGTTSSAVLAPSSSELESDLDVVAFGADRSELLQKLRQRGAFFRDGRSYSLTRPGRQHSYLGPCVSEDSKVARKLIEHGMRGTNASGWFWDLLPENREAVSIAQELGFGPQRRLLRMVRGKHLRGKEDAIYAIAGFELG